MKHLKRVAAALLILSPILIYIGITAVNDRIAESLTDALLAVPLPPETKLLDSQTIAGRQYGNGNGMQYFGMLLVTSDLSADELLAHYRSYLPDAESLEVERQETQLIPGHMDYMFEYWENDRPGYRITLARWSVSGAEGSLWEGLLNCDVRGH